MVKITVDRRTSKSFFNKTLFQVWLLWVGSWWIWIQLRHIFTYIYVRKTARCSGVSIVIIVVYFVILGESPLSQFLLLALLKVKRQTDRIKKAIKQKNVELGILLKLVCVQKDQVNICQVSSSASCSLLRFNFWLLFDASHCHIHMYVF